MGRAVVGRCGCGMGNTRCAIGVGRIRKGLTGIRIGKVPFRIRLSHPVRLARGPIVHPITRMRRKPIAPTTRPTTPRPRTPTTNGNITMHTPLPNAVGTITIAMKRTIGGNSAMMILRTVGVRGGVGTRGSKAMATMRIDGNSSIHRNTVLMAVKWAL